LSGAPRTSAAPAFSNEVRYYSNYEVRDISTALVDTCCAPVVCRSITTGTCESQSLLFGMRKLPLARAREARVSCGVIVPTAGKCDLSLTVASPAITCERCCCCLYCSANRSSVACKLALSRSPPAVWSAAAIQLCNLPHIWLHSMRNKLFLVIIGLRIWALTGLCTFAGIMGPDVIGTLLDSA
jgi:hypothetical protein